MKYTYSYETDIGRMLFCEEDGLITEISLNDDAADGENIETSVIKRAHSQIEEYLLGNRKSFDIPISPKGTDFQKSVWQELLKIGYGKTCCYKDIAVNIGNPKACRAVGSANGKNPIIIVIPCHRVIASGGKLGGYSCGIDIKKRLLKLEKENNV